jgi:tripartite-type tricarboxylate transporter receptor subunit TctC
MTLSRSLSRTLTATLALLALLLASPALAADETADWPTKPVRLIVPFPPGGTVDPLARIAAEKLGAALGQRFLVENRPGAGGSIGAAAAARSPADGYTFLFAFDTHAVNPSLIPDLPFDTVKDLAPVMLIGTSPMTIATLASNPYQSFADVIRAAKQTPGALTYGSIGSGSLGNLTMALLQQGGGFELLHVPYKGGAPLAQDALGGHIELAIGSVALLAPHVKSGKLRALAVTGTERSSVLPDVLPLAEQGFSGFSALSWWAVFAPAGTPQPILDRFHRELAKAFALPDVQKTLRDQLGIRPVLSSPDELRTWLAAEMQRWGEVVRANQIRPD